MGRMSPGDILHVPMFSNTEQGSRGFSFVVREVTRSHENAPVARYELTCNRCSTRISPMITDAEIDTDLRARRHYLLREDITEAPFRMMVDGHRPRCMVTTRNYPTIPPVTSTVTASMTGRTIPQSQYARALDEDITRRREENVASRAVRQAKQAAQRVKEKRRERLRGKHNVEIVDQDIRMIRND